MNKNLRSGAWLLIFLIIPTLVGAQQLFDFNGQVILPTRDNPSLSMVSRIYDPAPGVTPLPLDFDDYEYTLVIEDLLLLSDGFTQDYFGGRISIIEDNQTPTDFSTSGASFVDGRIILQGYFATFNRTIYTSTLGVGHGIVNWTGGAELSEFRYRDWSNWNFLTGINRRPDHVMDGYSENWDGKLEHTIPVVPNQSTEWSRIKNLYR